MKMRKWLARKLFVLASRLDWDGVVQKSRIMVAFYDSWEAATAPKKKRGRPAGRKDSVGGAPVKRKLGRPLGSKNRPKIVVAAENGGA
jgi:hypothetical protein